MDINSVESLLKFLILNLPNFAGMVIAVLVCIWVIIQQQKQITALQGRIDELCGDKTPGKVEGDTLKP